MTIMIILRLSRSGYDHYTLHADIKQMPLKWYECQPVVSNKIVVMHIQSSTWWSEHMVCTIQCFVGLVFHLFLRVFNNFAYVRPESDTLASVIWAGNTWNYRNALDEAGVKGARVDVDDDEPGGSTVGKYYRILKSFNVAEDENKVQDVIKNVFHNLAMKVVVDSDPVADSYVSEMIDDLRKLPNLHFE